MSISKRKYSKKKIIILINNIFDFFYVKKFLKLLIKKNYNFEIWSLNFVPKTGIKKYQVPRKKKFLNKEIIEIKTRKKFIDKVVNSKNHFYLTYDITFFNNQAFFSEKFINRVTSRFGIIQKSDDFFLNLLYQNSLTLNFYKPTLFLISKYKYYRAIKFLKGKTDLKNILLIKKLKKIYTGYFCLEKFKKEKIIKNYLIYLPHYSNLTWGDKYYSCALAFNKIFETKRKNESLMRFCLKKLFQFLLIFTTLKSIKIFFLNNEKKVLSEVSNFCKKNNLSLIIKTRKKNTIYNFFNKFADKIIIDNHKKQNPNYLETLLPGCKLVVCYSSQSVYECVFNNVPVFNLDNLNYTLISRDIPIIDNSRNGEFNYDKLIYKFSISDFLNLKYQQNLKKIYFSQKNKKKYLKKFLNFDEDFSGETKILSYIRSSKFSNH